MYVYAPISKVPDKTRSGGGCTKQNPNIIMIVVIFILLFYFNTIYIILSAQWVVSNATSDCVWINFIGNLELAPGTLREYYGINLITIMIERCQIRLQLLQLLCYCVITQAQTNCYRIRSYITILIGFDY